MPDAAHDHEIRVSVTSDPSDGSGGPGSAADAAKTLRQELQQADVRAEYAKDATRSFDPATIKLLITAAGTAIPLLLGTIQAFTTRSDKSTVTIETDKGKITLSGKQDAEEQAKLLAAFRQKYLT